MNSSVVLTLGLSAALLLSACGQNDTAPPASKPDPAKTKALTEALFGHQDKDEFQTALKAARAGKVSEQAILEARFLFLIDQRDDAGIAGLVPDMLARKDKFKAGDSAIFAFDEEWQSVIHYAQALAALEKNDPAGFKNHITEAYWLSPRQASIFTPHIEDLRLRTAMSKIRVDLQQVFLKQDSTTKASLRDLAAESSHLLLHFWSPWAEECVASVDDFVATSNELTKNQVAVIAILADSAPDILPDATSFRSEIAGKSSCTWLVDDPKTPLGRLLRVAELPTVALIDKSGSVLFNGHPSSPELWKLLQQFAPDLVRPQVQPALPAPGQTPSE